MKEKLRILTFVTVSVFLMISCSKYDNMLDFDMKNMGIDGTTNWGIPLVNAEYNIEAILNQFGNMDFINYSDNGNLFFEYILPKEEYLNVDEFNDFPDIRETINLPFPIDYPKNLDISHTFDTRKIDVDMEDIEFKSAMLTSGEVKLDFSHISIPAGTSYTAYITSHSIRYPNGNTFNEILTNDNPVFSMPCNNVKIEAANSQLSLDITITLHCTEIPTITELLFDPIFILTDVDIKEAEIVLKKEFAYPIGVAAEFSIFPQNISIDATVHNPTLMFDYTNTCGFDIQLKITRAYLKGAVHIEDILLPDAPSRTIFKNQTNSINISDFIKDEIRITSTYDSLVFEFEPYIKAGPISIQENATLSAGANFSIPFDLIIDEATFKDTLDFNLQGLSDLSILDTVTMRTAFESSIPSDFGVQILLFNSKTHTVVDTLLSNTAQIKGSYTGIPVTTPAQYIVITNDRIQKLQDANKMILSLALNTDGKHAPFNKDNTLHARIGARIKTSTNL